MKSEIWKLNQKPFTSKKSGKMYRRGTRNSNCLDTDRMMDFLTIPIHWKKVVVTIWNPTMKKMILVMKRPLAESSSISGSFVNRAEACLGKKVQMMKQRTDTAVAHQAVYR